MPKKTDKKSYIFLDESGKPEVYSRKGTNLVKQGSASKFLIIVAVRVSDQLKIQELVTEKRLEILRDKSLSSRFSTAYSLNAFHAQTDYKEVKESFYKWINECPVDLKISAIIAEKMKAYSSLQRESSRMYATVAGELLKRLLHTAEDVEVIFSRRDSSLKARERLEIVVDTLGLAFANQHNFNKKANALYHHNPHYTHGGLQIADYVAHALFQLFENKDRRWWDMIKDRVGYVQDIFNKKSYSRSNPL